MSKERKSELQKAADRVREMQVAVEKSEAALKICERDYSQAQLKVNDTKRNLEDTRSLLNAQREKLQRELNSITNIVCQDAYSGIYPDKCEVSNRY